MAETLPTPDLPGSSSQIDKATSVSVLVVEDSAPFRLVIEASLSDAGYHLIFATTGTEGLEKAEELDPDVVLLDIGLPDMDGIEVCRRLRLFTDAYIIMVTGRNEEVDRLVGLSVGADDYIAKPFSARELALRIQVMLRRPRRPDPAGTPEELVEPDNASQAPTRVFGELELDVLAHEVRVAGQEISLTKIEFDLLTALSARPEMVYTRELLVETVWGTDWISDTHVVDVHMANLRKKIDIGGRRHIKTVRGVGYRLMPAALN